MVSRYAALRFSEDENISDRIYWYACSAFVRAGDRVLAPVGSRDRLQCAVVERVLETDARNAPYDPRYIKRVAAKAGARKISAGGESYCELGGVRYDSKRYTQFCRAVVGRTLPAAAREELVAYGVGCFLEAGSADLVPLLRTVAAARECVLLYGAYADMAAGCLLALAGAADTGAMRQARDGGMPFGGGHGTDVAETLADMGLTSAEIRLLKEKLH